MSVSLFPVVNECFYPVQVLLVSTTDTHPSICLIPYGSATFNKAHELNIKLDLPCKGHFCVTNIQINGLTHHDEEGEGVSILVHGKSFSVVPGVSLSITPRLHVIQHPFSSDSLSLFLQTPDRKLHYQLTVTDTNTHKRTTSRNRKRRAIITVKHWSDIGNSQQQQQQQHNRGRTGTMKRHKEGEHTPANTQGPHQSMTNDAKLREEGDHDLTDQYHDDDGDDYADSVSVSDGSSADSSSSSSSSSSVSDADSSDDETLIADPLFVPSFSPDLLYFYGRCLEAAYLWDRREGACFADGTAWAQCDRCKKWRLLPVWVDPSLLPTRWLCEMNPDLYHANCSVPEVEEGKSWLSHCDAYCSHCEQGMREQDAGYGCFQRDKHRTSSMPAITALRDKDRERDKERERGGTSSSSIIHNTRSSALASLPPFLLSSVCPSVDAGSGSSSISSGGGSGSSSGSGVLSVAPPNLSDCLFSCRGPCCRSFHSSCVVWQRSTPSDYEDDWYCNDCRTNAFTCFVCGVRGSEGTEVKKCDALCGKFYHPHCIPPVYTHPQRIRQNIQHLEAIMQQQQQQEQKSNKQTSEETEDSHMSVEAKHSVLPQEVSSVAAPAAAAVLAISAVTVEHEHEFTSACSSPSSCLSSSSSSSVSLSSSGPLFICPLHWCAYCHEAALPRVTLRCVRCPVAYHCSPPCRPLHIQLLTETTFICDKHRREGEGERYYYKKKKVSSSIQMQLCSPDGWVDKQWIDQGKKLLLALNLDSQLPINRETKSEKNRLQTTGMRWFADVFSYVFPSLPLHLSDEVTLLSIGRIIPDRPAFHTERCIYSVGYKIIRTFTAAAGAKLTLLCEIMDGQHTPVFKVTPIRVQTTTSTTNTSTSTAAATVTNSSSSSSIVFSTVDSVWDRVLDTAWSKAAKRIAVWGGKRKDGVSHFLASDVLIGEHVEYGGAHTTKNGAGTGASRFGLLLPAIRQLIEEHPLACLCNKYQTYKQQQKEARVAATAAAQPIKIEQREM